MRRIPFRHGLHTCKVQLSELLKAVILPVF